MGAEPSQNGSFELRPDGKSNKQIAEIIGLSESTIKNHFSSTLKKLHANNRTTPQ